MLKAILKISILVLSLGFHDSKVLAKDPFPETFPADCSSFTLQENEGLCVGFPRGGLCVLDTCSYNSNRYVPMTGCTHNGVNDKKTSEQKCAYYQSRGSTFSCTNLGGAHYTCPYDANAGKRMHCGICKAI
ncbi:uncharacterized protein MELLADRAFT_123584 [Melampsora larici-populina 98AG31]|uniref:Secreted protein n=1 Tax=Melampsora larici-populina (strain 98AG31 / pathotype 3-4-7) TaxID=747676 RepID=F4RI17_MELLP|nr:uncharacterized protein MELLADRAFT_123584 [Melampsora larici-populina 98AG31]EGG07919.1 secreted protein [Melampsora larici-populina 98AG31]